MSNLAIYPGTFDPITYGHLDVIKRTRAIFSEVIVAVAQTSRKKLTFKCGERLDMVKQATKDMGGVKVEPFDGLVVNFARKKKTNILIRGLRMISDFEYEFQMALTNRRFAEDIETVFLMPSENHSFISSTLLKETASLGADISSFVPGFVEKNIKAKMKR
ncbi:MAG: pantetheine-phosphate adenylyltransferase [Candidatus Aceula meridiana]|nr:pantetheine-phosphate adenylyltransferase [Candidatus Aceula meridiana]